LPNPLEDHHNGPLNFLEKIIEWDGLADWSHRIRSEGRILVATNGCFDLLHAGHVQYLEEARNLGGALLIGVNSDRSVRKLKGDSRPVTGQDDRLRVLAALESVNGVCLFDGNDARAFLKFSQPNIYVKGGDYNIDTVNQDERQYIEYNGGRIVILSNREGRSSSTLIDQIKNTPSA